MHKNDITTMCVKEVYNILKKRQFAVNFDSDTYEMTLEFFFTATFEKID